jgi:hypothetical protein
MRWLFCLGFLAAGCATDQVQTDWDNQTDFTKVHTFAWATVEKPLKGDPRLDNPLLDQRIKQAVDEALALKGYQKVKDNPDVWLNYNTSIQQKVDVTSFSTPYVSPAPRVVRGEIYYDYGWSHWGGTDTFVDQYEEGTLVIDVADAKTKKLIWRGTVSSIVQEANKPPEKRDERVREAVNRVLAGFPPTNK